MDNLNAQKWTESILTALSWLAAIQVPNIAITIGKETLWMGFDAQIPATDRQLNLVNWELQIKSLGA